MSSASNRPPPNALGKSNAFLPQLVSYSVWAPPLAAFMLFLQQVMKFCKDAAFFVDDPFISMRFAANLLRFGELSFNPGVKVEGYSNLLHVLMHAALFKFRGSLPDAISGIDGVAVVVFLFSLLELFVLLQLFRLGPRNSKISVAWYYSLVLSMATLPFAFWACAGLETPIEGWFYLAIIWVISRSELKGKIGLPLLAPLFFGVTLIRFEGILVAGAVVFVLFVIEIRRKRLNQAWLLLALTGIPALAYHGFRWWYFGHLLPNTYVAKATGGSFLGRINAGIHYDGNWFAMLGGGLTVVALIFAYNARVEDEPRKASSVREALPTVIPVTVMFVAIKMTLVAIGGGDWMPGFRMLVPITPFAIFLSVYFLMRTRNNVGTHLPVGWSAVLFALAIPFVARGLPLTSLPTDTFQVGGLRRIPGGYVAVGRLLSKTFSKTDEVAIGEAGLIPFEALNVRFLDMFGLVDEDMARQPGGMHQRVHVNHLLERKPTAVLFAHLTVEPPYGPYQYGRELLSSEKFHSVYRRVDIGSALQDFGWALYLDREADAKSHQFDWSLRDPFVDRLTSTSK